MSQKSDIPVCTLFNDDTAVSANTSNLFPQSDENKEDNPDQVFSVFDNAEISVTADQTVESDQGDKEVNNQPQKDETTFEVTASEATDQIIEADKNSEEVSDQSQEDLEATELIPEASYTQTPIIVEDSIKGIAEGGKVLADLNLNSNDEPGLVVQDEIDKVKQIEENLDELKLVEETPTAEEISTSTGQGDVTELANFTKPNEEKVEIGTNEEKVEIDPNEGQKQTASKEPLNKPSEPSLASLLFTSAQAENDPFGGLENQFNEDTDAFTSALSSGEVERRQQAWIPSAYVKNVLETTANFKKVESQLSLTRPELSTTDKLGNPMVAQLKLHGVLANTPKLSSVQASSATPDADGLKQLIMSGNLRAAVDLTGKVLTNLGQGMLKGSQMNPSKNSLQTLQWWNARFSLLLRLKLSVILEQEMSKFKDFESPDLYYAFYPDMYPGRRGSMVPFSLRLLHANFPTHNGNPSQSLGRLFKIKHVVEEVIKNLENKKTEDGMPAELKPDDLKASLALWKRRRILVLHCIGSTQVRLREYGLAFKVYDQIIEMEPSITVKLQSCVGRWFLQLGDIKSAQTRFSQAEVYASDDARYKSVLIMNRGFLYLGANNWKEALNHFNEAIIVDSTDLEAYNNKAVCLLYLCRLKDAIATLEYAIYNNTESLFSRVKHTRQYQQSLEGVCSNLVTLYELESARFHYKRTKLLQYIATHSGDWFDTSCLKL